MMDRWTVHLVGGPEESISIWMHFHARDEEDARMRSRKLLSTFSYEILDAFVASPARPGSASAPSPEPAAKSADKAPA